MTDPDGKLLAEAHGLMVRLLPGQPLTSVTMSAWLNIDRERSKR